MSKQKYTVITGASAGIGRATANAFAQRGCNLILVARRQEELEVLKQKLTTAFNIEVVVKACDLSIPTNVHNLYGDLRKFNIETWINNAGFGDYSTVASQNLAKIETMLRLNVEALTVLSSLYVGDYENTEGAQLINLSSRGGYMIVPNAVTYCATKFYVGAFTEGLAHELHATGAKLRAKVLAPAATKTEFGKVANGVAEYDYDKSFGQYHSSEQMAGFLLQLYDSDKTVGIVDFETFQFDLQDAIFPYAGNSTHNQMS